jgi:glycosyltransferase involved in cell wall biosynthesis
MASVKHLGVVHRVPVYAAHQLFILLFMCRKCRERCVRVRSNNGTLVDPTNQKEIADACIALITSQSAWDNASERGRTNIVAYSWPSHCARYLRTVTDQKAVSAAVTGSGVGGRAAWWVA